MDEGKSLSILLDTAQRCQCLLPALLHLHSTALLGSRLATTKKRATGRQPVAPEFLPATGLLLPVASRPRLGRGRSGQARQQQAQYQPERQNPRRQRHRVRSIASAPARRQGVFARPRGADEYRGSSSPSTSPSTA